MQSRELPGEPPTIPYQSHHMRAWGFWYWARHAPSVPSEGLLPEITTLLCPHARQERVSRLIRGCEHILRSAQVSAQSGLRGRRRKMAWLQLVKPQTRRLQWSESIPPIVLLSTPMHFYLTLYVRRCPLRRNHHFLTFALPSASVAIAALAGISSVGAVFFTDTVIGKSTTLVWGVKATDAPTEQKIFITLHKGDTWPATKQLWTNLPAQNGHLVTELDSTLVPG